MSGAIITVEGLGKRYRIGGRRTGYFTLRDSLVGAAGKVAARLRGAERPKAPEEFWALRDVSFEVRPGEVVGVIGRNGAGKSTLLKILSRITEPTAGRATLRGRVGSLLEVGTGFHGELSGRDNIYLSGAVLGMKRAEIARKFDEIVAFAGVEPFLDTPIKHFSSGMNVRLGFAVAAHLEPEILLVDEVLAVGDAEFQKRCLGKMGEVARGGRTVIFVSHNMAAVLNFCQRGLVLSGGRVQCDCEAQQAVSRYMSETHQATCADIAVRTDRQGGADFRFTECRVSGATEAAAGQVRPGERASIRLRYRAGRNLSRVNAGVALFRLDGMRLGSLSGSLLGKLFDCPAGEGTFVIEVPSWPLNVGRYILSLEANVDGMVLDRLEGACVLEVVAGNFYPGGRLPSFTNPCLFHYDLSHCSGPGDPAGPAEAPKGRG